MSSSTPERAELVGTVLGAAIGLGRDLMTARRTPFGGVHLSASQLDAVFMLAHDAAPLTPGVLAHRLGLTPGAVTQLIDGLRELDLVEQGPNPSDARSRHLRLTDAARERVGAFEAEIVELVEPRFEPLSTDELRELVRLLALVERTPETAR